MREAIGGTWLFQIVIFFVLLFTGYMCLSINHTRAFDVKDKIINEIERNGGFRKANGDDRVIKNIVEYMKKVGYRATGKCDADFLKGGYGVKRNGSFDDKPSKNENYSFCIKEVKFNNSAVAPGLTEFYSDSRKVPSTQLYGDHVTNGEFIYLSYYKIQVFYKLDLPVIGQLFNFSLHGETKTLYNITNTK